MSEQKLEKAIKGLECCLPMTARTGFGDCKSCPYDRKITLEGGITECSHELMSDALTLLKAQEPVKPVWNNCNDACIGFFMCGACGMNMGTNPRYCWYCGKPVKWE